MGPPQPETPNRPPLTHSLIITWEIAAKEERSTLEVLDYLIDQELKSKEDRALGLRMRMAGFPMEKRLEDFDMSLCLPSTLR